MNAGRVFDRHPQAALHPGHQPPRPVAAGVVAGPKAPGNHLRPAGRSPAGDYAALILITPSSCASEISGREDAASGAIPEAFATELRPATRSEGVIDSALTRKTRTSS